MQESADAIVKLSNPDDSDDAVVIIKDEDEEGAGEKSSNEDTSPDEDMPDSTGENEDIDILRDRDVMVDNMVVDSSEDQVLLEVNLHLQFVNTEPS